MRREMGIFVLLVLLLAPVFFVAGQEVTIQPNRRYYQMGDSFFIHIRWNGTNERYFISLGPHLKIKGARYVSGVINRVDPDQYWTVEVETWNTTQIFITTYYDIGFADMQTASLTHKIHKDVVIVNLAALIKDYNQVKQELNQQRGMVASLKSEVGRYEAKLQEAEKATRLYMFIAEYSRKFNKYFDYVKFVNKSLNELAPTLGQVNMQITVPTYYDPYDDTWKYPQLSDFMVKEGTVFVRVPWISLYQGNQSWVSIDALQDPKNYFNQLMWQLWFTKREEESKSHYKFMFNMSWAVPLIGLAVVVIFLSALGFIVYRIWRKFVKTAEERGVLPPI